MQKRNIFRLCVNFTLQVRYYLSAGDAKYCVSTLNPVKVALTVINLHPSVTYSTKHLSHL